MLRKVGKLGEKDMKFLHLSDLHLGKRVHNFSMIEDQRYILEQVLKIIDEEEITSVIIAGDVYDKPVPSAEAVALFDEFLVQLAKRNLYVFVISGNHDSAERIAFFTCSSVRVLSVKNSLSVVHPLSRKACSIYWSPSTSS